MKHIEIALIAALYDSKQADFYRDIYFPIIKYSVADMYYSMSNQNGIYEMPQLQAKIEEEFGIKIPLAILSQCVKALELKQDGVRLRYYKDSNLFQVKEAWESQFNSQIENRAQSIRDNFSKLEILFQQYLASESLESNKTFIDFFSDYTEETLDFIESGFAELKVNQEYANLARFIAWISKEDANLYLVVTDVLWASIIAAFLQRKNFDLNLKPVGNVKYYLDTSLVLAVLGLDSDANVAYAKELVDNIKEAGGIPEVHPLTIREVSRILDSVVRDGGPREGSAIELGYRNLNYTPALILNLKNGLSKTIHDKYKIEVGFKSEKELDQIENKYRNNSSVKKLAKKWMSQSLEPFREIHDIYLSEFVFKENMYSNSTEKRSSFFVTKNVDLIHLAKDKENASLIHPGKVIMSLWMHSASSSLIKKSGLVEAVSRCFAMNQTDVRRKIRAIARYANFSDFSAQDVDYMYKALIHRSNKTIESVDELTADDTSEDDQKKIKVEEIIHAAIGEEKERETSRIKDQEAIGKLSTTIEQLTKKLSEAKDNNQSTQKELEFTKKSLKESAENNSKQAKVIEAMQKALDNKEKTISLNKDLEKVIKELKTLDEEREKSVSYIKFWIVLIIEIVFVGVAVASLIWIIWQIIFKSIYPNFQKISTWAFIVSLLGLALRLKDMYILSPKVKHFNQRKEQLEYWDGHHPEYEQKKEEVKKLREAIKQYQEI